jgi:hypothetical protein
MNSNSESLSFKYTLLLEFLVLVFSIILTLLLLLPLTHRDVDYPFFVENAVFVGTFILVTRYIFFLKYSFLAKQQVLKVGLVFLFIPFIFYLISCFHDFRTFLDVEGLYAPMRYLPAGKAQKLGDYMYYEMVFFGSGAILASIIFPFRLIHSVWTLKNRGKV